MVRLQTALGAEGIRRGSHVARAVRSHLAARHSSLQQVSPSTAASFVSNFYYYGSTLIWIYTYNIYIYYMYIYIYILPCKSILTVWRASLCSNCSLL